MNSQEHELQYPLNDVLPEAGTAIELVPGIRWVQLPLPFALNHINVWLLRDSIGGREGWTLIDCGVARDELKAVWQQVFAGALDGLPVLRVLVTHMHPDHVGLAHWICARFNAPLMMTLGEYSTARLFSEGHAQGGVTGGDRSAAFYRSHGMMDEDALNRVRARASYYSSLVPALPPAYQRLMHGDVIQIGGRSWQVVVGYGHSPEHASLYCAELETFISGDMVLPRISTNVSVHDDEPYGNPLKLYLDSLENYAFVPSDTLILPSHGKPFRGIHTRIGQQKRHHADRLDEVRDACNKAPHSALDIVPIMFPRKLDLHQLTFALGESLAHLNMLYLAGELEHVNQNGVNRFVVAR